MKLKETSMKNVVFYLALIVSCLLLSCSEDEYDISNIKRIDEQVNTVTFKIYSEKKDVPIRLDPDCCEPPYQIFTEYYEWTVPTKNYVVQIVARCDDPRNEITGEIYINGKLKGREKGKSFLKFSVKIKGHPYP